jgi:hypothetical protein
MIQHHQLGEACVNLVGQLQRNRHAGVLKPVV